MENGAVYNETTEPHSKEPRRPCGCTRQRLKGWRLAAKVLQPLLSLLAVIFEIMEDCINCGGLYFFEFTSCSAFLLSLLILCVYCTVAYDTFGKDKVTKVVTCRILGLVRKSFTKTCTTAITIHMYAYGTHFTTSMILGICLFMNLWAMLAIGVIFLLASIVLAATSSALASETTAYVFGFFASGAFLAEFVMEYWDSRKRSTKEHSQNSGNTQGTAEDSPLNRQS